MDGGGIAPGLERPLRFGGPGAGTLRVEAVAAACDHDDGETSIFAACHVYRQAWDVTVIVVADGEPVLDLPLSPAG